MSGVPILEELRPRAFAVAYRMLGSVSDAEDIVQEALLRLHHALEQGERIESPRAYLSTVVTRLCIDQLRSARVRRESYVGEWLPEPLVDDGRSDPADHAEMADSLSLAFLVLLESLTPEQRAAFLLREVFDYPYAEIAAIIGTGEDNARQLVARARKHVDERRPRFEASQQRREQLAGSFLAAVGNGELEVREAARPTTLCFTVTVAAGYGPSPAPSTVGPRLPGCCWRGCGPPRRSANGPSARCRSTANPAPRFRRHRQADRRRRARHRR